ncbi:MAG: hypothetical protein AAFR67_07910, partial [Chloroflexota bacterium]
PAGWFFETESNYFNCSKYDDTCHFVIEDATESVGIVFRNDYWVIEEASNTGEMANAMWEWAHESDDLEQVSYEDMLIQGNKAYIIRFTNGRWHNAHIYIEADDDTTLFVMVSANNEASLENNWQDILAIVETMSWQH